METSFYLGVKFQVLATISPKNNCTIYAHRYLTTISCCLYEADPQSKFPWGRVQKQNTIAWKYLLQQIQQVFSSFQHIRYRN
jgi:N-acetyl-anhydromuramyl-L-alanine amidase AmpD